MPEFELDPRLHADRGQSDAWEDIGALDDLDMTDFMKVLRSEHNVQLDKQSSILEVGVGKARLFKRLRSEGYDVTGVEARKRDEHTPDLPVANIRIEEMPFSGKTATFDMVIGSSIFDKEVYIQNQKLMLKRIVDSLRPGGIFLYGFFMGFGDLSVQGLGKLKMPSPYNDGMAVYQKI